MRIGEKKVTLDNHYVRWEACIDCGKERWVPLYGEKPQYTRCKSCAQKRRQRINAEIVSSKPPQEGEIRTGRELDFFDGKRRMYRTCPQCGVKGWIKVEHINKANYTGLCNECARKLKRGKHRSGTPRFRDRYGYIHTTILPDSPFIPMAKANNREGSYTKQILEHRLVMAEYLGKCLEKHEIVHHLNGIKDDNRIKNLVLVGKHSHDGNTFVKTLQRRIRELEGELTQTKF